MTGKLSSTGSPASTHLSNLSLGVMLGIDEGALGVFIDGRSDGIEDGSSTCDTLNTNRAADVAI